MRRLTLVLVMVTLLVVSCAPKSVFTPYNIDYIKKDVLAEDILIMETEPDEPYIAIGFVEVKKSASTSLGEVSAADLIPLLKEEASAVGGDAVINVKFETFVGGITGHGLLGRQPGMMATGTVIVFE